MGREGRRTHFFDELETVGENAVRERENVGGNLDGHLDAKERVAVRRGYSV